LLLTPFERNPEIWRQLWRVLERSDLIVQILDARDPLLFRSLDLEKYISEFSAKQANPQKKLCLLMLNKADLLSTEQRQMWADYFTSEGIRFVFFSAYQEQLKIDEEEKEQKINQIFHPNSQADSEEGEESDTEETTTSHEPTNSAQEPPAPAAVCSRLTNPTMVHD